jgi:hypothetical protein
LLASQVAEGRAIENRSKFFEHQAPTVNPQRDKRDFCPVETAVGETRRSLSRVVSCWNCSGNGNISKDCPPSVTSVAINQGNEGGLGSERSRRGPSVRE